MAGHSKFKNIMYRKSAQDQKRAKVFTKLIRELTVAAKQGGDPDANPRLRAAIAALRAATSARGSIVGRGRRAHQQLTLTATPLLRLHTHPHWPGTV